KRHGCNGAWRKRREKWSVLAGHDCRIRPRHTNGPCSKPGQTEDDAIRLVRKTSGKIELQIAADLGAFDLGTEYFKTEQRLPDRTSDAAVRINESVVDGERREIDVINGAPIAEEIYQNRAREAHAIFRSGFDFRLVLFVDLRVQQFLIFLQLFNRTLGLRNL